MSRWSAPRWSGGAASLAAGRRIGVRERLRMLSKGDGCADAVDGLVAEGDVEGIGLVRVRVDEGRELRGARVVFATAPDRFHVRGDGRQLGEVALQFAVVVGGIEQAFAIGSAIRIGENGEAREVNLPAAKELDAGLRPCSSRPPRCLLGSGLGLPVEFFLAMAIGAIQSAFGSLALDVCGQYTQGMPWL